MNAKTAEISFYQILSKPSFPMNGHIIWTFLYHGRSGKLNEKYVSGVIQDCDSSATRSFWAGWVVEWKNTDGFRQGTWRFTRSHSNNHHFQCSLNHYLQCNLCPNLHPRCTPSTIDAISHKKHQPDKNGQSAIIEGEWIHNSIIQELKLLLEVQM